MSKSTGDVVNPLDLIEQFGADAFRYFVTREMNVGQDSEFSLDLFMSRYNSDLANDLGNLVSRLLNMGGRYTDGKVPVASVDEAPEQELKNLWEVTKGELIPLFDGFQFHKALDRIFTFISGINKYAETRAPWKLAKSETPEDRARLETSLAYMAEALRLGVVLLTPVMPDVSDKVRALIGGDKFDRIEGQLDWGNSLSGRSLGEKTILFPRPERPK